MKIEHQRLDPLPEGRLRNAVGCFDCAERTNPYMVSNDVWLEAWPGYPEQQRRESIALLEKFPLPVQRTKESMAERRAQIREAGGIRRLLLCYPCLEERLGRTLCREDFTETPINNGIRVGMRCAARDGGV